MKQGKKYVFYIDIVGAKTKTPLKPKIKKSQQPRQGRNKYIYWEHTKNRISQQDLLQFLAEITDDFEFFNLDRFRPYLCLQLSVIVGDYGFQSGRDG